MVDARDLRKFECPGGNAGSRTALIRCKLSFIMYSSDYRASDSMRVGSKGSPTIKYAATEPMLIIASEYAFHKTLMPVTIIDSV